MKITSWKLAQTFHSLNALFKQEVRKLPKVSDRIRSIYRLGLRKYKMDTERNKVKQKMNTSLNGSFLLQATPRKSKPVTRYAVICKTFCPCLCCKEDTDPANLLIFPSGLLQTGFYAVTKWRTSWILFVLFRCWLMLWPLCLENIAARKKVINLCAAKVFNCCSKLRTLLAL